MHFPIAIQTTTPGGQWGLRAQAALAVASEQAVKPKC